MADFDKSNAEDLTGDLEEYEPEIVDLDGEPFEIIDSIEHKGVTYVALTPYIEESDAEQEDENEESEFVILKEIEEDGEFYLATIDDDEIYNEIGDRFLSHFKELFENENEE